MKKWIIKLIVGKVIKMAIAKTDTTSYIEIAADVVDKSLDKVMGETSSEILQDTLVQWLNINVKAFTKRLKKN